MGKILSTLFANAATEGSLARLGNDFVSNFSNAFGMPKL